MIIASVTSSGSPSLLAKASTIGRDGLAIASSRALRIRKATDSAWRVLIEPEPIKPRQTGRVSVTGAEHNSRILLCLVLLNTFRRSLPLRGCLQAPVLCGQKDSVFSGSERRCGPAADDPWLNEGSQRLPGGIFDAGQQGLGRQDPDFLASVVDGRYVQVSGLRHW